MFFIFPSAYPIVDTIIAFSVPTNQKLLTKHLKHQYGVIETLDLQRSNKLIQWSLLIGVVLVLGILGFTGNLSTPFMIYLGMCVLAVLLSLLLEISKKQSDRQL